MPEFGFNSLWSGFKRVLKKIGDIQSRILLTAVYFTLLLPMGIMIRCFCDWLAVKPKNRQRSSYWALRESMGTVGVMEKARRQF